MHRPILLTIAMVVATSMASTVIDLEHELLTGDLVIGSALAGTFSSKLTVNERVKQYLKSVNDVVVSDKLFEQFRVKFAKSYENRVEESRRAKIFAKNVKMVLENNVQALHSESQHTLAILELSDMELEEALNHQVGNWPPVANLYTATNKSRSVYADSWVFDTYREHHQVGRIQNQGGCGSCAYFATAATIESAHARQGHPIIALSAQQLVNCARDPAHGNNGCNGGTFVPTFNYVKQHGMTSWDNYPYTGHDGACDHNKENQAVAHIRDFHSVVPHSQDQVLEQAINAHGPIAVAIHVSDSLMQYRGGVYGGDCQGGRNHAILLVGYGYDAASNQNYWILKNQWGEGWGEHGFFRIRRDHGDGHNNWCDVAGDAVWVE